ncbi:hypothetical protein HK097_011013 [Rhizophlyctis rosea]|uniref:Uncharacterized protein n=1 Tax=Rhizophlyctis rosea TaxID=64517 RepID=A0AAD5SHW4_9FUNG|nr:hypothetical protein HK097_011013 [Rhizophlyctis rosea]
MEVAVYVLLILTLFFNFVDLNEMCDAIKAEMSLPVAEEAGNLLEEVQKGENLKGLPAYPEIRAE